MGAPRDKSYGESLTTALKNPEEAAAYLDVVMELQDPAALLVALRRVAAAHGMAEVARRAETGDKTLFRSLGDNGNPTLATLQNVVQAGHAKHLGRHPLRPARLLPAEPAPA